MIQILIIDDQALVRTGLRHILDQSNEITRVTEASSGEAGLRRCRKHCPDVILLSINLPGLTGFELTRKLKRVHPGAKIIILAAHAKPPYPTRLMDAGAELIAPPTETPWRSLNSRLEAPAGLQITLFEELEDTD